jgi:iron complex outermembrane recepter protein
MKRQRLLGTVAAVAVVSSFQITGALPALAQQQSAQAQTGIEEIVVTARKREENLVDVPLAISAFSAEMIEQRGIESVADVANQTPGFSFRQGFGRVGSGQGGGASSRPSMRGQSNIVGIPNVGFFVDGVFVSGNITSYQLDNVERIEVIRGPQSALFGRGTFAGAMNFITRKPSKESIKGKVEVTAGNHGRYEATGFIGGPIIQDKLAVEVDGRYYKFGGDWLNRSTGRTDGGKESSRNTSGKLYFTPNDDFEVEVNGGWSKDVDGFFPGAYSGINCDLPNIVATIPFPRSTNRRRGYYCGEIESPSSFFSRADILDQFGLDGVDRTTWRGNVKANYDINDWSLSAILAANKFRNLNSFDSSFEQEEVSRRPAGLSSTEDRRRDWSVEARIESPRDQRLHGLLGLYSYNEDDGSGYRGAFTLGPGAIPISPTGERVVVKNNIRDAARVLPAVPAGNVRLGINPTENDSQVRNWSVFGLLDFEITEDLKITGEGRYQSDKITNDPLIEDATNVLLEDTFKKFLPRVTALYKLNENWNIYANVAEGNKPGGFNTLASDADAASRAFFIQNFQTYGEESAWTYELGLKGANENRTVTMNSSVYWIDWSDQQLTSTFLYTRPSPPAATATTTSTAILNAGQTRIRGLEVDLNAQPFDSFDVRLAYSLTDAKLRNFIDPETEDIYDTDGRVGAFDRAGDPNGQTRGQRLPQVPKHQIILSGSYRQTLSGDWTGFIRSDLTYESRRFDQVHNLAHTGDSYLLNVRTGVETDQISLTFFVNNALDDRTPAAITRILNFGRFIQVPSRADPAVLQTTFFRDMQFGLPRKRTFGVTANYKF